jgi:hypothetical protein
MFGIFAIAAVTAAQSGVIAQSSSSPQVNIVPTPPPIIAVAPPAPPMMRSALTRAAAVPVRIRVVAGTQVLLNDTLRVSGISGASYQESRSEAPETVCSAERYYSASRRDSLSVNLYQREETTAGPLLNVSVSWTRPSRTVGCGGEGTRQVQLTQTVPLAPGQSVTLQGDAGLTVTVSR